MNNTFHFDISKTGVFRALKTWSFPLFRYSSVISQFFLYVSIVLVAIVLLEALFWADSLVIVFKIFTLSLFLGLIFWEVHLFLENIIKKPQLSVSLHQALQEPERFNMAEFLSLGACSIVENAIKRSKQKKLLGVNSEALLYFALRQSKPCQVLLFRLGLDYKKVLIELKNHLEKQHREHQFNLSLSLDFINTIQSAAKTADIWQDQVIGEKELLVGLAHHDPFFKKILIEQELKEKDVENIAHWLFVIENRLRKSKQFWLKENLAKYGSLGKDFASGFTPTLDQYGIEWRDIAKKSIFNQVIGHQSEIDELEIILAKSSLGNALLVGDVGAGRKSIVEALSQRCFAGTGLAALYGKRVVELNMVSLISQIKGQEDLEVALDQIFKEVLASGNVILVIDELDNFVEQKNSKPGAVDISVILGKYLPLPSFHFIGITSFDGLHRKLEQSSAFLENFRRIEVQEISEAETIMVLQNMALQLERRYKVLVTYPAIREIINLTGRYFPSTPFPKKAIDILEEVAVFVGTRKEVSLGSPMVMVLPSHVAKVISDKTKIPLGKMEFKEKSVLLNLESLIHQRLINQKEAVSQIAVALRRYRSGISSKKRPLGVFLFLGPTGVGKTETAKALADIYFNGENHMVRLDMSEFQELSDIGRLIGKISPVEEQGLLTTPVRENPFSLVLLDEIEKAHPNILNLFLQVFDEGHITDGQGRKVIFTNTIIICTSNAGANMIFAATEAKEVLKKEKILNALFEKGIFKPEFINRFDAAVLFHPLTKENLLDIAQLALEGIQKNLKEKDITFVITSALKEKIVDLSYKPEFGARELRRVVQDNIENNIASALLSDKITNGDTIEINPLDFGVIKNSANRSE